MSVREAVHGLAAGSRGVVAGAVTASAARDRGRDRPRARGDRQRPTRPSDA